MSPLFKKEAYGYIQYAWVAKSWVNPCQRRQKKSKQNQTLTCGVNFKAIFVKEAFHVRVGDAFLVLRINKNRFIPSVSEPPFLNQRPVRHDFASATTTTTTTSNNHPQTPIFNMWMTPRQDIQSQLRTHRVVKGWTSGSHSPDLVGTFGGPGENVRARVAIKSIRKTTHDTLFDQIACPCSTQQQSTIRVK